MTTFLPWLGMEECGVESREAFETFFTDAEPLVRRALVSRFGPELGRDATAEGFAVAWRSWSRVARMENGAGYVYRTSERWAARQRSRHPETPLSQVHSEDSYPDGELAHALDQLSPRQRQAVVLIEGFGLTHREAAEFLGCGKSSIQNHVERGMARLRKSLEANDNA